jgi:hypothetical protein
MGIESYGDEILVLKDNIVPGTAEGDKHLFKD